VQLGLNTHKGRQTILAEGNIVPVQAAHVYSASRVQMHAFLISLQMTGQRHVTDVVLRRKHSKLRGPQSWAGEFVEYKVGLSRH
jgi:hypothetical protein